jgi:hypothetical protein
MWRFNGPFLGRAEEILLLALLCVGTPAQGAEAPILPLSKRAIGRMLSVRDRAGH